MFHSRQQNFASCLCCHGYQDPDNSQIDSERNLNSYNKTSLKQKKKTTTTTSQSRISNNSNQKMQIRPQPQINNTPSNLQIRYGRTEQNRVYKQQQKQNPIVNKQPRWPASHYTPQQPQLLCSSRNSALQLKSKQYPQKQHRKVSIIQQPLFKLSQSSSQQKQSPTFGNPVPHMSKIAQPSQSALRTVEQQPDFSKKKKFFSEIKNSMVSTVDHKTEGNASMINSDIRPRTFTQGSLIKAMRKTQTLMSKGSQSEMSMGSQVMQNMDSMLLKFKKK